VLAVAAARPEDTTCINSTRHLRRCPFRVRTVMENLEKSWNFKMVISRPGKVMEKT